MILGGAPPDTRKAKRVGAGKTGKRAAELAAIKIQARLAEGDTSLLDASPDAETFEQAAESWLATYSKLGQLQISTESLYRHNLRTYAFPRFGHEPIAVVTRDDIRCLVADLLALGRSRSLVRNVVAPIRQTFNQLLDDGNCRGKSGGSDRALPEGQG